MSKSRLVKKKQVSIFVLLVLILLFTACGGNSESGEGGVDNSVIETYVYLSESLSLTHITDPVHSVTVHEGRIYLCYAVESAEDSVSPTIVVEGILPDGTQVSRTEIPTTSFDHVDIATLYITEAGNFALILTGLEWTEQGREDTILYLEYTRQGIQIMSRELTELPGQSGDWIDADSISVPNIRGLYSARDGDSFDWYIDDGRYLFGYTIATSERTLILNWIESRVEFGFRSHLNFLDDGRLSLLVSHGDLATADWRTEHVLLTRTPRAELPEYTVITLGAVRFGDWGTERAAIAAFNRENRDYQIQVVEYLDSSDPYGWYPAQQRFLIDLMTGNAPDIIFISQDIRDTLIRQGLLADLYPFLDADPTLSRADFFPNVLGALETPDGSLPTIDNAFVVETMIGMADAVGDMQSWTFADMLALVEQADTQFLLGEWTTAERSLDLVLQFSGDNCIN